MDNILNNIGDVLNISLEPKMSGRVRITGFVDDVEGVTEERTCKREFRILTDGLFWSDWTELTTDNLSAQDYVVDNSLFINLRYTRTGTDVTGTIVFRSIDFSGTRTEMDFIAPTLMSSILGNAVGTDYLSALEHNLFKKLYYRGIVADYVERGANNDYQEDKDYIDLFYSIARFYALFITFFKRWENFSGDFDLLREQVRGYGLYFNEGTTTLEELKYLAQNLFSQAQQRGTQMIFNRAGEKIPVDGEFIRLTRNKEGDELLSENIPIWKSGWCMRQSSPLYRGTAHAYNLNKTKENTEDFQNLDDFVINKNSGASYSLISEDDKRFLRIQLFDRQAICGLGRIDSSQSIEDNVYGVDSQLDYEVTFAFRLVDTTEDVSGIWLKFGIEGFDVNKEVLSDAFIDPNGALVNSEFMNQTCGIWKTGVWYFARGIIHAYSTQNTNKEIRTNLGVGNNLYFNNSFVKYILPKIQFVQTTSGVSTIDIWDYKIRPLVRGKNILPLKNGSENSFSLGFVQGSKLFHTYFRNNNNSQSQEEVTDIIERYLYPFDTTNLFTVMNNN